VNKPLQVYIMLKHLCKNVDYFQCTEHSNYMDERAVGFFYPEKFFFAASPD